MSGKLREALQAKLAALDGPDWDSGSDNDGAAETNTAVAVKRKPSNAKQRAKLKAREQAKGGGSRNCCVIYVGHIPHGFYEEGMKGFFSQFGDIKRLRVARSKKTAKAKGYAFVEFASSQVAQIVAETMDGYFLYDKQLQCHVIPREKVHPRMFDGAEKRFKAIPWHQINAQKHNERSVVTDEKHKAKLMTSDNNKRKRLAAMGIEYEFEGYKNAAVVQSTELELEAFQPRKKGKMGKAAEKSEPEGAGGVEGGDSSSDEAESKATKKAPAKSTKTAGHKAKGKGKKVEKGEAKGADGSRGVGASKATKNAPTKSTKTGQKAKSKR
ncbi:unnamed protein product [Chrysoparadoxa australica]